MSIFNDPRRYSDDPEEYEQWKSEVEWECRRDNYEPDEDLVLDVDEKEGSDT